MIIYSDHAPTPAQKLCPHKIRNRAKTECATCGSMKGPNGRWLYMDEVSFWEYATGGKAAENEVKAMCGVPNIDLPPYL